MDSTTQDLSRVLIELGLIVVSLAILARIARRWAFSAIPLSLLAGLAFGKGGLATLNLMAGFNHIAAEIGVLFLLFMFRFRPHHPSPFLISLPPSPRPPPY